MLQFSRVPNAMHASSQHFQLVYFCRFATFSKARHAVLYSVASKNVVRTCSSCTSMIRFRRLDKYVNTKFLADLDLLSNALALQMAGGLRRRSPPRPPFEKHGQRSEHTGFLTVHRLVCFARCLHHEIAGGLGGAQPPPIRKTWTRIRTHISSCTPLMDVCVAMCFAMLRCVLICEILVICNMLTLPSGANTRI